MSLFNESDMPNEETGIDGITPDNLPIEFVKQYLRVEHDFDDIEIKVAIASAQSYVRNHIKQPKGTPMDMELIIPMLTLVAFFYENKSPMMKSTEKLDAIFSSILNLHRTEVL